MFTLWNDVIASLDDQSRQEITIESWVVILRVRLSVAFARQQGARQV